MPNSHAGRSNCRFLSVRMHQHPHPLYCVCLPSVPITGVRKVPLRPLEAAHPLWYRRGWALVGSCTAPASTRPSPWSTLFCLPLRMLVAGLIPPAGNPSRLMCTPPLCSPVCFSTKPTDSNCFMMWRIRPPLLLVKCSGTQPLRLLRPPNFMRSWPTPRPWRT
jgi:hypothetical protein